VVQVNGRLRASLLLQRGVSQDQVLQAASQEERVKKYLENKQVARVVFVPDKLINIVVRE
jgi:leucyl-tRNA synthetase